MAGQRGVKLGRLAVDANVNASGSIPRILTMRMIILRAVDRRASYDVGRNNDHEHLPKTPTMMVTTCSLETPLGLCGCLTIGLTHLCSNQNAVLSLKAPILTVTKSPNVARTLFAGIEPRARSNRTLQCPPEKQLSQLRGLLQLTNFFHYPSTVLPIL
jgi:hypothetical protein